jgi:two-component system copper resistance phosphate regulon response regulator CusR
VTPTPAPSRNDDGRSLHPGQRLQRILIIEDEQKTATFLEKGLRENGFEVTMRTDGELGLQEGLGGAYDLIILDVGLPKKDGWAVIEELKAARVTTPVIFLTAHDGISDRVRGLDQGADDYLVKPFAFAELLARVRLALRRSVARSGSTLAIADLSIDLSTQKAFRNGQRIDLTQTELSLLIVLMRHSPATVPRRLLVEEVWDMHFDSNTNVVDVTVKRLRTKIDDPFPIKLIRTVRGIGYACVAEQP